VPGPPPAPVVADRFEPIALAGRGGMGVVYRARDLRDGGFVALKLLALGGDAAYERFRREARVLAALRHPGIVRHVDDGRTPAGEPYLAMEWLDGEPLHERMKRDPVPMRDAVAIVRRVAEALAVAHTAGVVHRDLKPANLFLRGGRLEDVVLLDFGLAHAPRGEPSLTRSGAVLGTAAYMAPEQAAGERDIGARADVFALGCLLYELVTAIAPFRAETFVATLARVLLEDPPPLGAHAPAAPANLEALVSRMLAKAPGDRPAHAGAVVEALRTVDVPHAAAPAARADLPAAVGEEERRVVSIVLAHGVTAGAAELSAEHHAPFAELADGSRLCTIAGSNAADQAARAVIIGRALAARDARVAVATGMSQHAGLPAHVKRPAPLGDAVDRAAALLLEDRADSLRIDDVTERLVASRADPSSHGPDGFVGRARELGTLEAIFRECVEEPVARAAVVVGAAGMGKSRLLAELLGRLRSLPGAPEVLLGACEVITAGASFRALGDAVRRAAGILPDDTDDASQAKLASRVQKIAAGADAERIAQFLGEIARVPFPAAPGSPLEAARRDPALRGDQMRRAVEDWLAGECASRPVVLVLEDLHWGDGPTVDLVDAVLRRIPRKPLFVLALARPEIEQTFPALFRARGAQEIVLGPILRSAAAGLVRARLGREAADAQVDEIVACADGHPFLLDELARAAAEGRALEGRPETAIAIAHGVLDRLEGDARRVLRAASVFGGPFRREGVAALVGGDAALGGWLGELERRDVIRPGRDGGDHVFRHDLLREAAYAALTHEDRRRAHALAGRYLEAAGHDDALALARHFDRGGVADRAAHWYRRSAELALEGNDVTGVLERARLAEDAGASGRELGLLGLLRAEAHMWRGENQAAEEHATGAMALLPRGSAEWFRTASEAAAAAGKLRHRERLEAISADLLAVDAGPELDAARIAWARAALQFSNLTLFDRADALLARIEAAGGAAAATPLAAGYVHSALAYRGEEVARVRHGEEAVRAFEAAGHERNACLESLTVGHGLLEIGGFRRWLPRLRAAKATAERLGLRQPSAIATMQLAAALFGVGELEEAERAATQAGETFRALENAFLAGAARSYLAAIAHERGDLPAAEAHARAALASCADVAWQRAFVESLLARTLAAAGRIDEALATVRSAASSLEKGGARTSYKGTVRLVVAEVLHAAGLKDEARRALAEARDHIVARASVLDGDLRAGFLTDQRDHAATLRWAEAWL
jgi:tetratricopeptide (TPR) repeat protein